MTLSNEPNVILGAWFDPVSLVPPHRVTRPEQVELLAKIFTFSGWDRTKPTLRGYLLDGGVQLLSGTHRRAAAIRAHIKVPVVVWDPLYVEASWGTLDWDRIMGIGMYEHEGRRLYDEPRST